MLLRDLYEEMSKTSDFVLIFDQHEFYTIFLFTGHHQTLLSGMKNEFSTWKVLWKWVDLPTDLFARKKSPMQKSHGCRPFFIFDGKFQCIEIVICIALCVFKRTNIIILSVSSMREYVFLIRTWIVFDLEKLYFHCEYNPRKKYILGFTSHR